MRWDHTGCVDNCKTDDVNALITNFASTKCIQSCYLEDGNKNLDVNRITCINGCPGGQYKEKIGEDESGLVLDYVCRYCNEAGGFMVYNY